MKKFTGMPHYGLCLVAAAGLFALLLLSCGQRSGLNQDAVTQPPTQAASEASATQTASSPAVSPAPDQASPEPDWQSLMSSPQKVMVISIDPVFTKANGKRQHELVDWWNDPKKLAGQYAADMAESSHGNAVYEIAEWHEENDMPQSTMHKEYSTEEYYSILTAAINNRSDYWADTGWRKFDGFDFDYDYYFMKYNVYQKVESGQIDEVWIFTGPCSGPNAYESLMIGRKAYWCNSPPMIREDCRAFVCYAFNYERDVGCMLEDAGHRFESIMSQVFDRWNSSQPLGAMNDWEKFTLYDLVSPGNAACGNVHFSPNSRQDYDWGNSLVVQSTCEDWFNYPNLTGKADAVNASAWGGGDMRAHHMWWMKHIPYAPGTNSTGVRNNWWIYFKYPTLPYGEPAR